MLSTKKSFWKGLMKGLALGSPGQSTLNSPITRFSTTTASRSLVLEQDSVRTFSRISSALPWSPMSSTIRFSIMEELGITCSPIRGGGAKLYRSWDEAERVISTGECSVAAMNSVTNAGHSERYLGTLEGLGLKLPGWDRKLTTLTNVNVEPQLCFSGSCKKGT